VHLSTPAPVTRAAQYGCTELWIVELRLPGPVASLPYRDAIAGTRLRLPAGGSLTLLEPSDRVRYDRRGFNPEARGLSRLATNSAARLWLAELRLPESWRSYLDRYGFPIRYSYVPAPWPSSMYQTVFATEPGSAEMPSAGRPFSSELVTSLVARGVQFAPILLHTGVSSLEDHEPPYEEYYRVSPEAAELVNAARRRGSRVVGVGTTAVRALETVTDESGTTRAGDGWTSLVITRSHVLRSVDSMITGLHEPSASHLMMLDRVLRALDHLDRAYGAARRHGYLWHEFGDSHLILGSRK
jgi:S-adenosylmethionine:tRNA ribosyltransferase-isomerase